MKGTGSANQANNRTLVNDVEGRVLRRVQADALNPNDPTKSQTTTSLLVNGEVLGSSTNPGNPGEAGVAPFASAYAPLSDASLSAGPSAYTVQAGQTLQSIAQAAWGDSRLWYLIAEANGIAAVKAGDIITLPAKPAAIYNAATTTRPYDSSRAVGDTTPIAEPASDGGGGCGGVGKLIALVVTIAVAVSVGGPLGAALGSIAGQTTGMVLGVQEDFSWKQVALSAISAGVTQGLPSNPLGDVSNWANAAARATIANVATQAIGVATGLQDKFSWRSVAAGAVGAGVGSQVGEWLGLPANGSQPAGMSTTEFFGKALIKGLAAGTTAAVARGGRVTVQQVATDAFGNVLGESLARAANSWQSPQDIQRQAAQESFRAREIWQQNSSAELQAALAVRNPWGIQLADAGRLTLDGVVSDSNDPDQDLALIEKMRATLPASSMYLPGVGFADENRVFPETTIKARREDFDEVTDSPAVPTNSDSISPIGAWDGFLTFNAFGRTLSGATAALGDAALATPRLAIEAANWVRDAWGYASHAAGTYQPNSGLMRSIEQQGVLGTLGSAVQSTVQNAPGIGLIAALGSPNRNWSTVGAQGLNTGLMGAAGMTTRLSAMAPALETSAAGPAVLAEMQALQRIGNNQRLGLYTNAAELRQAYLQARTQVDFAHIEADVAFRHNGKVSAQGGHFYNSPKIEIVPGTETVGSNGVVRAQVKLLGPDGNWHFKNNSAGGMSSLTPSDWSMAQAKAEMSRAWVNRVLDSQNRWQGVSDDITFRFIAPTSSAPLWRSYPLQTP